MRNTTSATFGVESVYVSDDPIHTRIFRMFISLCVSYIFWGLYLFKTMFYLFWLNCDGPLHFKTMTFSKNIKHYTRFCMGQYKHRTSVMQGGLDSYKTRFNKLFFFEKCMFQIRNMTPYSSCSDECLLMLLVLSYFMAFTLWINLGVRYFIF